jgi:mannose-1-phosphate guanylyltransferase
VVGNGATVRGSVIGAAASVGDRTVLDGAVVGDEASVGADNELAPGARVWCGAVLPDGCIRFSSDEASS